MTGLRKNRFFIGIIMVSISGCVTPSRYHANRPNALGTDIEVSPDRIIAECEFITDYEGDYPEPHGFMIHILDKEKTVLTISSGTVLAKKDCFARLKISEKIIKNANIVFFAAEVMQRLQLKWKTLLIHFPSMEPFMTMAEVLIFWVSGMIKDIVTAPLMRLMTSAPQVGSSVLSLIK